MKAAVFIAPGKIELRDVPEPTLQADQVKVKNLRVAICGSDLHRLYDGRANVYPYLPGQTGHECVGEVDGRRVLFIPGDNNAFAPLVPVAKTNIIAIPEHLSSEEAVLAQQLGTVIFCNNKLQDFSGKKVAVIGQGPAGLLFTSLLRHKGVDEIASLDIVENRLKVSKELGSKHTINPEKQAPSSALKEAFGDELPEIVIEAVGKEETINMAIECCGHGGTLVQFGVPKTEKQLIDYEELFRKNLRVVASVDAQGEPNLASFREAIRLISEGYIDVKPLISHVLPFSNIVEAFRLAESKDDNAVKVFLSFEND